MAVIDRTRPRFAVPVFVVAGPDRWSRVQRLRADDRVRLVASPRHATILLEAGTIPDTHRPAADRVHDQIPHPRGSVEWTTPTADSLDLDDVAAHIVERFSRLDADSSTTSPDRLDDDEPNRWRGVGPFGQGGEGMMGGTPYGRPMAMTSDDRDGMSLDRLDLRLGPFLDALPGGLVVDLALQGEVVQQAEFDLSNVGADSARWSAVDGLEWLVHALHVQGLDAHACRAAHLAVRVADPDSTSATPRLLSDMLAFRRALRWSGSTWPLRSIGAWNGGDARTRWIAILDRITAHLEGASTNESVAPGPAPTGDELGALVTGMTTADAITTIVSFDLAHRTVGAAPTTGAAR